MSETDQTLMKTRYSIQLYNHYTVYTPTSYYKDICMTLTDTIYILTSTPKYTWTHDKNIIELVDICRTSHSLRIWSGWMMEMVHWQEHNCFMHLNMTYLLCLFEHEAISRAFIDVCVRVVLITSKQWYIILGLIESV